MQDRSGFERVLEIYMKGRFRNEEHFLNLTQLVEMERVSGLVVSTSLLGVDGHPLPWPIFRRLRMRERERRQARAEEVHAVIRGLGAGVFASAALSHHLLRMSLSLRQRVYVTRSDLLSARGGNETPWMRLYARASDSGVHRLLRPRSRYV